jgi:hypothetical protein
MKVMDPSFFAGRTETAKQTGKLAVKQRSWFLFLKMNSEFPTCVYRSTTGILHRGVIATLLGRRGSAVTGQMLMVNYSSK